MEQSNNLPISNDEINTNSKIDVEDTDDSNSLKPFDPAEVDIKTEVAVVSTVLDRIERSYTSTKEAIICLDPEFQRKSGIWTEENQSKLIESILLGIPLPMFYVASNKAGQWDVVDGIQRLGVLRDFVLGEKYLQTVKDTCSNSNLRGYGFKLKGLEFLKQFEGKQFIDLPPKQQDDIRQCNLQVTIIRPGTPELVKFNIFKRINTGGSPLTNQEIRHALHQGSVSGFLKELVETESFRKATSSYSDERMEGRELILRMFAALLYKDTFSEGKVGIDDLLNNTMSALNEIGGTPEKYRSEKIPDYKFYTYERLRELFLVSMERASQLFGSYAFRKSIPDWRRTPINKALFETWSVVLAQLPKDDFFAVIENQALFWSNYSCLFLEDDFLNGTGSSSYLSKNIQYRYQSIQGLLTSTAKGFEYAKEFTNNEF